MFCKTGHLQYFLYNWKTITEDSWILQSVVGHKIEFLNVPCQSQSRIPVAEVNSQPQRETIQKEVDKLLLKGAVTVEEPVVGQFISSLFLIPQKSGKLRPVINLHSLNTFVNYRHFKMEGIKFVKDLLMPGDFGGLIDLKDAYFMIPIYEGHRKYLRFVWQGQLFQFTCLPFGLSSAPRTFTKILKPVAAQL